MLKVYKLKCLDKQEHWDGKNHHYPSKLYFLSHIIIISPAWPLCLPSLTPQCTKLIFLRLWIVFPFQELYS